MLKYIMEGGFVMLDVVSVSTNLYKQNRARHTCIMASSHVTYVTIH